MSASGQSKRKKSEVQGYHHFLSGIQQVLEQARHHAARSVNAVLTAAYWEIGRRIVVYEQRGQSRAEYGEALLKRLSKDLALKVGRGFGTVNLSQMKKFYLLWPLERIFQTVSEKSQRSADVLNVIAKHCPLPWSVYVRLLSVKSDYARQFYEAEALRGGWSVRQLDRQINSQFYERAALSRNKAAMLKKGAVKKPNDRMPPDEEIKDPYSGFGVRALQLTK